jgi:hypothetical protein
MSEDHDRFIFIGTVNSKNEISRFGTERVKQQRMKKAGQFWTEDMEKSSHGTLFISKFVFVYDFTLFSTSCLLVQIFIFSFLVSPLFSFLFLVFIYITLLCYCKGPFRSDQILRTVRSKHAQRISVCDTPHTASRYKYTLFIHEDKLLFTN